MLTAQIWLDLQASLSIACRFDTIRTQALWRYGHVIFPGPVTDLVPINTHRLELGFDMAVK